MMLAKAFRPHIKYNVALLKFLIYWEPLVATTADVTQHVFQLSLDRQALTQGPVTADIVVTGYSIIIIPFLVCIVVLLPFLARQGRVDTVIWRQHAKHLK
jgi:hypothetical protein